MSLNIAITAAAGAAAGVFLDAELLWPARWVLGAGVGIAFALAAHGYVGYAVRCVLVAGGAVCVILGAEAQFRALHPPIRQLLDTQFGGFAIDTIGIDRHDTPFEIEGRLIADATISESGANLRVRLHTIRMGSCPQPVDGGVSIAVNGGLIAAAAGEWRAGRIVRMPAVLRRPARYLNHGVPDQERMLARRGIALVGSVKSAALVEVVARGRWFDEWASSMRAAVRRSLTRHVSVRDPQSGAVAIAILIGDRGSLDPDVEQRLQEAGTYHVIAISGGNVAILAGLVLALLWAAGIRGGWAAGAAAAVLLAYAHIAGGGASVMRATVMAAIYLSLRIIDQRTAPKHAMAITVAIVLLASPLAIDDVGLWLTFGATAAIMAGATRVAMPASPWLKAPIALLLASVCAEVVLMPIVAFVFQRVTVAGVVVNLAAVPSMAIVQVAAMLTTAADSVGLAGVAGHAGWVTHLGVRGLIDSAIVVDAAPWLTWRVPSPPLWVLVVYYVLLIVTVVGAHFSAPTRRTLAIATAGVFLWIAIAPATLARRFGDGHLHVTMIDVGQGDSILVTLPNGRTLLVDTGGASIRGDFDIGDRVIGPALRQRGIARLDYLAITHGDPDHIGGAESLARDFAPLEIWDGVFVNNHEPTMRLRAVAAAGRSAWRSLQRGDRIDLGGVELRVHHPPLPDWERQQVRNNDSLVIELRYGQVSILLTGDIGREVEQALLPTLDLLPIVVLKSPHHGSGTSSTDEFIKALRPRVVLISNGRANPYGHPVPSVLARYAAVGARVLRTDLVGQIDLVTDGESIETRTFVNTKDTKGVVSTSHRIASRAVDQFQRRRLEGGNKKNRQVSTIGTRLSKGHLGVLRVRRVQAFGALPIDFKLFERQPPKRVTFGFDLPLQMVKSPLKLVVGHPQRSFGLDAELSCDVDEREQQVSKLLFGLTRPGALRLDRVAQLANLFLRLIDHIVRRGPVEADLRGARAQFVGAQQRRHRARHPAQHRLLRLARVPALLRLDLFPLLLHFLRCQRRLALGVEDVRVAANQLVDDRLDRVGDRKTPFLFADLRQEHGFEQEVAELVLEGRVVVAIERIEQLIRLLQHERAQRLHSLLLVPRAAMLGAQRAHDLDELLEARRSVS